VTRWRFFPARGKLIYNVVEKIEGSADASEALPWASFSFPNKKRFKTIW
jgi:hypothetical protein